MAIIINDLILAAGVMLLLIILITVLADVIQKRGRIKEGLTDPMSFILVRLLLDDEGHVSLSLFQFLAWTLVISFLLGIIVIVRLINGDISTIEQIPLAVLGLMGISVSVPIISKGIYERRELSKRVKQVTYIEPSFASMLEEKGKPSFTRFQMFLWTILSIIFYIGLFMTMVTAEDATAFTLVLPDIDPTFLILMGISQAGYLGGVAYAGTVTGSGQKPPEKKGEIGPKGPAHEQSPEKMVATLHDMFPKSCEGGHMVTITGSGFGATKDTVILGSEPLPPGSVVKWDDGRVEFLVPREFSPGIHEVRVSTPAGLSGSVPLVVTMSSRDIPGLSRTRAEIIGDIWIDDLYQKGATVPPIGFFIPDKRYYFFYEFHVTTDTPAWGFEFTTEFLIDDVVINEQGFLPGAMNGKNYGVYYHVFTDPKEYTIKIRGKNTKQLKVVVKKP